MYVVKYTDEDCAQHGDQKRVPLEIGADQDADLHNDLIHGGDECAEVVELPESIIVDAEASRT